MKEPAVTVAADPTSLAPAPLGASAPSTGLRLRSLRKALGRRTIIDDLDLTG